jgi:hypothetical protein
MNTEIGLWVYEYFPAVRNTKNKSRENISLEKTCDSFNPLKPNGYYMVQPV